MLSHIYIHIPKGSSFRLSHQHKSTNVFELTFVVCLVVVDLNLGRYSHEKHRIFISSVTKVRRHQIPNTISSGVFATLPHISIEMADKIDTIPLAVVTKVPEKVNSVAITNLADEDDFKPSPMRFVVATLLCVSSALSGYILFTYVTIW